MAHAELVLKSQDLFFVSDPGKGHHASGLYSRDTRHLNGIRVLLNGDDPEVLSVTTHDAASATITSTNPASQNATLLPHTIAIEQHLTLGTSLTITWVLHNYAQLPVVLELDLMCWADFRDVFDIRGFPRHEFGTVLAPDTRDDRIVLRYQAPDGLTLSTAIAVDQRPGVMEARSLDSAVDSSFVPELPERDKLKTGRGPVHLQGVRLLFEVALDPGERWELNLIANPAPDVKQRHASVTQVVGNATESRTTIVTDNPLLNRVLERSLLDLAALTTRFPEGVLPAAGIPWYVAPFGRDSLITGLQTLHIDPASAEGTLRVLASLQGTRTDPDTEEEPGKILHEMRYGEMARLGEIPHRPYYGTIDATPLFVLLFAETVAWSANELLYRDLLPNVRAALDWVEKYGDTNGDGMIDYDVSPPAGIRIRHRVWKDSVDSLHHVDGREPRGRVTPVEVQGYLYAAYQKFGSVAAAMGDASLAARMTTRANALKERFELDFWIEDEGFYAQAVDGDGSQMRSVTSNTGQLLLTGIVTPERAAAVVRRLRQPDMESGWGVRTLSADSVTYNPLSYHNGSVWPHDNSLIAAGCYRVGNAGVGNAIFNSLFDAALASPHERLNELYCGFSRSGSGADAPVPYPTACSPQAWAAGTLPFLIRGALGLDVDFANRVVRVNPNFPDFFSEVDISALSVLGRTGRLRVRRDKGGYDIHAESLPL